MGTVHAMAQASQLGEASLDPLQHHQLGIAALLAPQEAQHDHHIMYTLACMW